MTKLVSSTVRAATSRIGARRAMSESAGPRTHKAKDVWAELQATRPPEGHPHVSEIHLLLVLCRDTWFRHLFIYHI